VIVLERSSLETQVALPWQQYADGVASLELLNALNMGANTVTGVASALGISHAEAARQLTAATASGLIAWEDDAGHFTDVDATRRFAHLSTAGLKELHRHQQAAADH
jgi:DNA-binding IclR family transcriptional regulator